MKQILQALFFAGLIFSVSFLIRFSDVVGLAGGEVERQAGAVMGIILIWFGNVLPKNHLPGCESCATHGRYAMRRFAGSMVMIGGAIQAFAWIIAPIEYANIIAMTGVAGSLIIIILRALITRKMV